MRLIDADAVLERIERDCDARCLYKDYKEPLRSKMCNCCELGDARMYVEDAPTIDAESIIRCKDCKYGSRDPYNNSMRPIWCISWDHYGKETDFCSRGERAEVTK